MTAAKIAKHVSDTNAKLERLIAANEKLTAEVTRLSAIVGLIENPVEDGWFQTLSEKQEAAVAKTESVATALSTIGKPAE